MSPRASAALRFVIAVCLLALACGGCERWPRDVSIPAGFRTNIVNGTEDLIREVTCVYPEAKVTEGVIGAGYHATSTAYRPKSGPIRVSWKTNGGDYYQAEFPACPEYIVRPEGILVIRIRKDHTVSVRGIADSDFLEEPWRAEGDVFQAIKVPAPFSQK